MMPKSLLCVLVFVCAGALAIDKNKTYEIIVPTYPPDGSSTTAAPTTTTTVKPTSTSTTTEHPPTTSTSSPNTTTIPTTTVSPVTTLVPPHPVEEPVWNVTKTYNQTKYACIVAKMFVNISVGYQAVDLKNKSLLVNTTKSFLIPEDAKASGSCGNDTQRMTLSWNQYGNNSVTVTFVFTKRNATADFMLSNVSAVIPVNKDLFPGINGSLPASFNLSTYEHSAAVPVLHSYHCEAGIKLNMNNSAYQKENLLSTLQLTKVQFEAFVNVTQNKFEAVKDCVDEPSTPDIWPIAVGISLAGLVAAVLISYVLARRRATAQGYVSM